MEHRSLIPPCQTADPAPIPQEKVENYHGYSIRILPPNVIPELWDFTVRVFDKDGIVTDPNPSIRLYDLSSDTPDEPLWISDGDSTWFVPPSRSYEVVYCKGVQGKEKVICRFGGQAKLPFLISTYVNTIEGFIL
ncbi:hypothetical protein BDZ97DRAFT_1758108 [Flammula alnicola]|nr:hypothetical protein BDZ97DRAFT_1758108 [Flammula alnicola]